MEQELAPALGALAKAVLDRQQFLAPAGVGGDQHQQALALVLQTRREVHAIGPEIDIAAGGEGAPFPGRVVVLPPPPPPPPRRRRRGPRPRPPQRRPRLRGPAAGDAPPVE